jgi:hypothetical protein
MTTKLEFQPIETAECGALIVIAFEGQRPARFGELAGDLYDSQEFTGKSLSSRF